MCSIQPNYLAFLGRLLKNFEEDSESLITCMVLVLKLRLAYLGNLKRNSQLTFCHPNSEVSSDSSALVDGSISLLLFQSSRFFLLSLYLTLFHLISKESLQKLMHYSESRLVIYCCFNGYLFYCGSTNLGLNLREGRESNNMISTIIEHGDKLEIWDLES